MSVAATRGAFSTTVPGPLTETAPLNPPATLLNFELNDVEVAGVLFLMTLRILLDPSSKKTVPVAKALTPPLVDRSFNWTVMSVFT